jgi:hypothetical protein
MWTAEPRRERRPTPGGNGIEGAPSTIALIDNIVIGETRDFDHGEHHYPRNVDDEIKARLRVQAAHHGRSMGGYEAPY